MRYISQLNSLCLSLLRLWTYYIKLHLEVTRFLFFSCLVWQPFPITRLTFVVHSKRCFMQIQLMWWEVREARGTTEHVNCFWWIPVACSNIDVFVMDKTQWKYRLYDWRYTLNLNAKRMLEAFCLCFFFFYFLMLFIISITTSIRLRLVELDYTKRTDTQWENAVVKVEV